MLKKALTRLLDGESMNALSPYGNGTDNRNHMVKLVEVGAGLIAASIRAPDATRFVAHEPMDGVPIIQREQDLLPIVAAIMAASVAEHGWLRHQFYYWARLPTLTETQAWRALERGLHPHGFTPFMIRDNNICVFAGRDFWLAEIRIALGTDSTHGRLGTPAGGR